MQPIPFEKINALRANFILNRLTIGEMARVLELDRKTVIDYNAKFLQLQQSDPRRLYALKLRLPKVVRPSDVPERKVALLKVLPLLVANYAGPTRTIGGVYQAYKLAVTNPLCITYFTKFYRAWLNKHQPDKYIHRWTRKLTGDELSELLSWKKSYHLLKWKRATLILGSREQRQVADLAAQIEVNLNTAIHWLNRFETEGIEFITPRRSGLKPKQAEIAAHKKELVIRLLHETPKLHGYNRTAWNCKLLAKAMLQNHQIQIDYRTVGLYIRESGFVFKKAREVLTSPDPQFREKVAHIKQILANLQPDEKFFSIDEYGPRSVKPKGGVRIVNRGEQPFVAKAAKGKGCFIMIAALELSTNQVSHFYTQKKDTDEIIVLIEYLVKQYAGQRKLYLSWDAIRMHSSKQLVAYLSEINDPEYRAFSNTPEIELAPLPVSAQFLNVIESVFSGMSRAVIHNSDYGSVEECQLAIDRYFNERNEEFKNNPQRAGGKLWGREVVPAEFKDTNHCKRASDN
jgi:transposase